MLSSRGVETVAPTGLPVGTFFSAAYGSRGVKLDAGDALVLSPTAARGARSRPEKNREIATAPSLRSGASR